MHIYHIRTRCLVDFRRIVARTTLMAIVQANKEVMTTISKEKKSDQEVHIKRAQWRRIRSCTLQCMQLSMALLQPSVPLRKKCLRWRIRKALHGLGELATRHS